MSAPDRSGATRAERILALLGIVPARVRGRRAWILCPFHDDTHATNCFVRTAGDRATTFHCYACKAKGNLVDLAAKVKGCSRAEAEAFVRRGAETTRPRASVRIVDRDAGSRRRSRFELPREIIFEPLEEWVSGARAYADERGVTRDMVDEHRIGYAVEGRLAGRIVFPVFDEGGAPAGYSARSFVGDEPRYLTPHESERADPAALFGMHLWPTRHNDRGMRVEEAWSSGRHEDRDVVVVTEGAIDAASIRAATRLPVAALSGSKPVPEHALSLGTFDLVVLATDADVAGDAAALALQRMLARSCRSVRLRFTGGDANEIFARDSARLARAVRGALDRSGAP